MTSQIKRAAVSIALNIAEGSTGQSDPEQKRYLSLALRSYLETVACLDIIDQCGYLTHAEITTLRQQGHQLFYQVVCLQKSVKVRADRK